MDARQNQFPLFRLLIGCVCISFSPILIKLSELPPDSAGFYRMFFAGISLFVLMCLRRESLHMAQRPKLFLLGSGIFLAIDFMCWHRSIALIGPGLSTLLANFQVFFTALFSWLILKQKVSRLFILAVVMALVGLQMITGADGAQLGQNLQLGLLFGLLAGVFYSGYILLLKGAMDTPSVKSVPAMLWIAIASSAFLVLATPLNGASLAFPEGGSLLAVIAVGVISTTIGWSLLSSAIQHIPATLAGLILLLQPSLALIWDVLIFNKPIGMLETCGILLVLSAIYIGSLRQ